MDWRAAACGGRNHLKARRKRRLYNNPIPAGLRRFSGTPELSIPQDPLDRTTGYYHGITVPTLTLKVTKEFKARLTRAARKRKLPVSEVVRAAVEKVGCRLVSGHSEYDGLVQAEDGQLLRRDAQLDAASDAGLLVDQAQLVERLEHLVD